MAKDEAPTEINNLGEVTRVRVGMTIDNSKDFKSRKKIVELVQNASLLFYREVGQKLKSYIPEPPKIKKDTEEKSSEEQEKKLLKHLLVGQLLGLIITKTLINQLKRNKKSPKFKRGLFLG